MSTTKEYSRKRKASKPAKPGNLPKFFWLPFGNVCYCLCRKDQIQPMRDYFGWTGAELLDEIKSGRMTALARTGEDGNTQVMCVVMVSEYDYSPAQKAGIIAHEAMHVVQEFMEYIGEERPSDEFVCYTLQEVVENLSEEYFGGDK